MSYQVKCTFDEQAVREQAEADGVTHFATGVAVVRDGKILVARRAAHDWLGGVYELPGGGVDAGETILDSAVREIAEETNLVVTEILVTFPGFQYTTPNKPKVQQINLLVTVAAGELQLNPEEHDEYRWITADDLASFDTTDQMHTCLANAFYALAALC